MTLEAILYVLLGFLLAIFLVLMLAPIVWNRAATLTEQKVRAALPIKPEEIEAEKDKLRAEHAMVVRRFEIGIKELREKLNLQTTKFHTKLRDNAVFAAKAAEDDRRMAGLEEEVADLTKRLSTRETEFTELSTKFADISNTYSQLQAEHEDMNRERSTIKEELSNARVELMAKDARIISLDTSKQAEIPPESAESNEIYTLNQQITQLSNELLEKGSRIVELEAELARQVIDREFASLNESGAFAALEKLKSESETLSTEIQSLSFKKRNTPRLAEEKEELREKIKNLSSKAKALSGHRSD